MNTVLGVIASVLTITIVIFNYIKRKNSERRKLAQEAGDELEKAQKNKSKSGRLNAWIRTHWMR